MSDNNIRSLPTRRGDPAKRKPESLTPELDRLLAHLDDQQHRIRRLENIQERMMREVMRLRKKVKLLVRLSDNNPEAGDA